MRASPCWKAFSDFDSDNIDFAVWIAVAAMQFPLDAGPSCESATPADSGRQHRLLTVFQKDGKTILQPKPPQSWLHEIVLDRTGMLES